VNSQLSFDTRYYHKQSRKRLFFASLSGTVGHSLDIDNTVEIGGDNGLRGYPLRYQGGDSKLLLSLEQRYFTDWYPFRLVRIGGAIFADVGRVWGEDPVNGQRFDWLTDVGFGLRFAPTRSSAGKLIHLDIAFPLGGDDSIDSVQFLLESKRSF
jgi:outer membrane protein assembly factor BamA